MKRQQAAGIQSRFGKHASSEQDTVLPNFGSLIVEGLLRSDRIVSIGRSGDEFLAINFAPKRIRHRNAVNF